MKNSQPLINAAHVSKLERPWVTHAALTSLLNQITTLGGTGILVGGCVRDHLLGLEPKDIDIEVYGLEPEALERGLQKKFQVLPVGKSFGIFKILVNYQNIKFSFDVAVPRRDNKTGSGHRGFVVSNDPHMSFSEASSRRDFTLNAMGIDINSQSLLDPHGGLADLKNNKLRAISQAFSEDPLRVLRAAQFCARFGFELEDYTKELCIKLKPELATLSKERIYEEFKKLLLAKSPSTGLKILRETESLELFPELEALIGCEQDPLWHPEGDVWIHTLLVIDQAIDLIKDLAEDEKLIVMVAALCHDLGKPSTTAHIDGRIKSHGHDMAGVAPTLSFLARIGFPPKYFEEVAALVREHLKPYQLYAKRDEVSDGALRRLALRVNIRHLLRVSQADFFGRTTKEALSMVDPSAAWLQERISTLLGNELSTRPILLGRHLINLGKTPGPNFSRILATAFEAQLDGLFCTEEEAMAWLKNYLKSEEL
jgi:tRNA nucleotidyltransferase (CCA-adding enzyme)